MLSDMLKNAEVSIQIDKWHNKELTDWVNGVFLTEPEKSAAWAMFGHLCDWYNGVRELVRGELVETEFIEDRGD